MISVFHSSHLLASGNFTYLRKLIIFNGKPTINDHFPWLFWHKQRVPKSYRPHMVPCPPGGWRLASRLRADAAGRRGTEEPALEALVAGQLHHGLEDWGKDWAVAAKPLLVDFSWGIINDYATQYMIILPNILVHCRNPIEESRMKPTRNQWNDDYDYPLVSSNMACWKIPLNGGF